MRDWKRYVREHLALPDIEGTLESSVIEEIAIQLEDRYREARAGGATAEEADAEARELVTDWSELASDILGSRRFAAAPRIEQRVEDKEVAIRRRGGPWIPLADLLQDLRLAVRRLRRAPVFTAVALLTLGLGIGANTTTFSVVNGILLRPLPHIDTDGLVTVWQTLPSEGLDKLSVSFPLYEDWLELNAVFEDLGVYSREEHNLTGGDHPESIEGTRVTSGVFAALNVPPVLGRTVLPEDDQVGARSLVVLSHGMWQLRFGSDSSVVGQTMEVDEEDYTIAGVMPPGFSFPTGSELWTTFSDEAKQSYGSYLRAIARLKAGLSLSQAQREMESLTAQLAETSPRERDYGVRVVSYMDEVVGNVRGALLLLFGAAGMVLLIACANMANLLLVKATERYKELAVRTAVGANRGQLVRQLLSESVTLSIVGGAVGSLAAIASLKPFLALLPAGIPRVTEIAVDHRVLVFSVLLSLLTGVMVGVLPALSTGRIRLSTVLQGASRSIAGSRQGVRVQAGLVVSETALTFVLLVSAGLLIKSFVRLTSIDPGFERDNMLTFYIEPEGERYGSEDRLRALYLELSERLESVPGVQAVTSSSQMPFADGTMANFIRVDSQLGDEPTLVECSIVPASYFRVMGIPIVAGRAFTPEEDRDPTTPVTIVSQAMADRYWPEGRAVGRRIKVVEGDSESAWLTVVGVADDVHHQGLKVEPQAKFYWPFSLRTDDDQTYVLKTAVDPSSVFSAVQAAVWAIDPNILMRRVATLDDLISESVAGPRFLAVLVFALATLAAVLAVVGVFGVLAYTVAQRTHEIGVRIALGAEKKNVILAVLRRGLALVGTGLAIGFALALVTVRVLESALFEVSPWDTTTLLAVALLLTTAAIAASYVPARRATRVDPVEALRQE